MGKDSPLNVPNSIFGIIFYSLIILLGRNKYYLHLLQICSSYTNHLYFCEVMWFLPKSMNHACLPKHKAIIFTAGLSWSFDRVLWYLDLYMCKKILFVCRWKIYQPQWYIIYLIDDVLISLLTGICVIFNNMMTRGWLKMLNSLSNNCT